jgi:hypothetical protein
MNNTEAQGCWSFRWAGLDQTSQASHVDEFLGWLNEFFTADSKFNPGSSNSARCGEQIMSGITKMTGRHKEDTQAMLNTQKSEF